MKRSAPHHGNISRIPPVCTLLSPLGVCRRRRMFRFAVSVGPRAFTKTNDVKFACTIFSELPNQRSPRLTTSSCQANDKQPSEGQHANEQEASIEW